MPRTQKGIEKGSNNAMEYASQADQRGGLSPLRNDPPGGLGLRLARANNKNAKWKMRFGNARSVAVCCDLDLQWANTTKRKTIQLETMQKEMKGKTAFT